MPVMSLAWPIMKSPDIRISPGWPDALIAAMAARMLALSSLESVPASGITLAGKLIAASVVRSASVIIDLAAAVVDLVGGIVATGGDHRAVSPEYRCRAAAARAGLDPRRRAGRRIGAPEHPVVGDVDPQRAADVAVGGVVVDVGSVVAP